MSLVLRKNVSVPIGILLLLAVVCAAYGLYTTWQWWYATHNPNPAMPTEVVSISTDTPDETAPIETCDALGSTGQQPQSIRIASIGVDAFSVLQDRSFFPVIILLKFPFVNDSICPSSL